MARPHYRIDIHTGDGSPQPLVNGDAKVYLTLLGTKATSRELVLDPAAGLALGELHNGSGSFSWQLPDLGEVRRLCVRHDDAGVGPGLFLSHIVVHNEDSHKSWTFPCNRWLTRHRDDGEVERTLDAA